MNGFPVDYQGINVYNSAFTPSTQHVHPTGLARYFKRYLLQKAISVFEWELPDTWSKDYFLYSLYGHGKVVVFDSKKFGVIPQQCTLSGYDVFYRPTKALVANPLLNGIDDLKLGKNAELIRLQPDFGSIMDIINYYGDMLALCAESVGMNLANSHLSYIFTAENKSGAEAMKKLFDRVQGGELMVVQDKNLVRADGTPSWSAFQQNVGQNYIANEILLDMRKIEAMFATDVGIPNANTDKRERLIADEVNSNNVETASKCELWLDTLTECIDKVNKMFKTNISVKWRHNPLDKYEEGEGMTGDDLHNFYTSREFAKRRNPSSTSYKGGEINGSLNTQRTGTV